MPSAIALLYKSRHKVTTFSENAKWPYRKIKKGSSESLFTREKLSCIPKRKWRLPMANKAAFLTGSFSAGCESEKFRLRGLPTPHAEMVIAARGDCNRRSWRLEAPLGAIPIIVANVIKNYCCPHKTLPRTFPTPLPFPEREGQSEARGGVGRRLINARSRPFCRTATIQNMSAKCYFLTQKHYTSSFFCIFAQEDPSSQRISPL